MKFCHVFVIFTSFFFFQLLYIDIITGLVLFIYLFFVSS